MSEGFYQKIDDTTWRIWVFVQPGAVKSDIPGLHDQRLKVRIQAPPSRGKANKCLCTFLAREMGIRKNQVRIEKGHAGRMKTLMVENINGVLWKNFLSKYNYFNQGGRDGTV